MGLVVMSFGFEASVNVAFEAVDDVHQRHLVFVRSRSVRLR
jgi:hypothetical protein